MKEGGGKSERRNLLVNFISEVTLKPMTGSWWVGNIVEEERSL